METPQVIFLPEATRQLLRIAPIEAKKIKAKIDLLASNPAALANQVRALKGSDLMRLRVGDYRVIYTADLKVVTIVKVGHRSRVYG